MTKISLSNFLEYVERGEIPPAPPKTSDIFNYVDSMADFKARDACISHGMWAIVEKTWVSELAKWIGTRSCLEIMSGTGWLAKALSEENISIEATDNYKWHKEVKCVFPVRNASALDAVKDSQHDILIVSWPPYESHDIVEACEAWGTSRPIIYIGEGCGGCNAPDEFFERFQECDVSIELPTWTAIHDRIMIGMMADI